MRRRHSVSGPLLAVMDPAGRDPRRLQDHLRPSSRLVQAFRARDGLAAIVEVLGQLSSQRDDLTAAEFLCAGPFRSLGAAYRSREFRRWAPRRRASEIAGCQALPGGRPCPNVAEFGLAPMGSARRTAVCADCLQPAIDALCATTASPITCTTLKNA